MPGLAASRLTPHALRLTQYSSPMETYDVVVIGYGFAGAVAAIEASDAGASVLLIEKMQDPGGISICAGGGLRVAQSFENAYAYLQATNAGTTPDDVLEVIARGMTTLTPY